MWPFKDKAKETVAFGDILTGLQNAISQVQDMLQNRQLDNLSHFWDASGKPVSQTVKLTEKTVDVPLLTLVPHNQLAMDSVTIEFVTRVGAAVPEKSGDLLAAGSMMSGTNSPAQLSHAELQVAMNGARTEGEDAMRVSITFKTKDTPEALARLMDEYNKDI